MKRNGKLFFIPLFVFLLAGCQLLPFLNTTSTPTVKQAPTPTQAPISGSTGSALDLQNQLVNIYSQVNPGVVSVFVSSSTASGLGSGFVYDTQGHIITNAHVVQDMTAFEVDFPSGLKATATLVGIDLDSDLAVLKVNVDASDLVPLSLGDSNKVQVGQLAIAIGSPLYNYNSMTMGIISAIGREMDSLHQTPTGTFYTTGNMFQTDAAVNLGNSGGPLLDINGKVIGINRAIESTSNTATTTTQPGNIGISFAIPINIVKHVVPYLIKDGSYTYPYLGVSLQENLNLSLDDLRMLGLSQLNGLYVASVVKGGPSDLAGLHGGSIATANPNLLTGGDIINAIDGVSIKNYSDFISYLSENKLPGDKIVLTILRDNKTMEITVTLGSRPK
jgi:S1-C subfamily serine protease